MVLAGTPGACRTRQRPLQRRLTRLPRPALLTGETLAQGEPIQVARDDVVESRLAFKFKDGSLYDEQTGGHPVE
jgi:hypothetical protein